MKKLLVIALLAGIGLTACTDPAAEIKPKQPKPITTDGNGNAGGTGDATPPPPPPPDA